MAMIDYGAIAFKNGKLISTEMFTPMKDMVGWEDTENDTYEDYHTDERIPLKLKGNYFAYIGDSDCTAAFYKEQIVITEKYEDGLYSFTHEYFNCTNYKWSKWSMYVGAWEGKFPRITVSKRNGYYVCRWKYRGNSYKVYFGYGVDLTYYKKWHMVNYYRAPAFLLGKFKRWIKEILL